MIYKKEITYSDFRVLKTESYENAKRATMLSFLECKRTKFLWFKTKEETNVRLCFREDVSWQYWNDGQNKTPKDIYDRRYVLSDAEHYIVSQLFMWKGTE